jgi:hypothetical protein
MFANIDTAQKEATPVQTGLIHVMAVNAHCLGAAVPPGFRQAVAAVGPYWPHFFPLLP